MSGGFWSAGFWSPGFWSAGFWGETSAPLPELPPRPFRVARVQGRTASQQALRAAALARTGHLLGKRHGIK